MDETSVDENELPRNLVGMPFRSRKKPTSIFKLQIMSDHEQYHRVSFRIAHAGDAELLVSTFSGVRPV